MDLLSPEQIDAIADAVVARLTAARVVPPPALWNPPANGERLASRIVTAVLAGQRPMKGSTIARRLAARYNPHFRATLSTLLRSGVIGYVPEKGYAAMTLAQVVTTENDQ